MITKVDIPGYAAGTWAIDATRSDVSFQARLMGFVKVNGTFDDFEGTIVTAENPLESSVRAALRTATVHTRNKRRDDHLRSNDFLSVLEFPTMTFTSTGVRVDGDTFLMDGDLTVRGVTRQVTLTVRPNGFGSDDEPPASFTAATEISRKDFGVTGGISGTVIGDKVKITLEIKADRQV